MKISIIVPSVIAVLLVLSAAGWYITTQLERPERILLSAIKADNLDLYDAFKSMEVSADVTLSAATDMLTQEDREAITFLSEFVNGVKEEVPDPLTAQISFDFTEELEKGWASNPRGPWTNSEGNLTLATNLIEQGELSVDVRSVGDTGELFFRLAESPDFVITELKNMVDTVRGVWVEADIPDDLKAMLLAEENNLSKTEMKMVQDALNDFLTALVKNRVLVLEFSENSEPDERTISYRVDLLALKKILKKEKERAREQVLKPLAKIIVVVDNAAERGFSGNSQTNENLDQQIDEIYEDIVLELTREHSSVQRFIEKYHNDIAITGTIDIRTDTYVSDILTIVIALDLKGLTDDKEFAEEPFDGTLDIAISVSLSEKGITIQKPEDAQRLSELREFQSLWAGIIFTLALRAQQGGAFPNTTEGDIFFP